MSNTTSGYESAPSTILLATHCAACGRALRDAVSVERGVGPDCAEKYGYGEAQGPANWSRAAGLLAAAGHALPVGWETDAQAACNALVHAAALAGKESPLALAAAIAELGFARLGAKLAARLKEDAAITVTREGDLLAVASPYNPAFVAAVGSVRGQWWDKARKVRMVPAAQRVSLWGALKAAFEPGTLVVCGERTAAL